MSPCRVEILKFILSNVCNTLWFLLMWKCVISPSTSHFFIISCWFITSNSKKLHWCLQMWHDKMKRVEYFCKALCAMGLFQLWAPFRCFFFSKVLHVSRHNSPSHPQTITTSCIFNDGALTFNFLRMAVIEELSMRSTGLKVKWAGASCHSLKGCDAWLSDACRYN